MTPFLKDKLISRRGGGIHDPHFSVHHKIRFSSQEGWAAGGRTPAQGFFDDRGKAGDFRSCQKGAGHFMKLTGINPFTRPIPYENEIYFINDCALLWSQY